MEKWYTIKVDPREEILWFLKRLKESEDRISILCNYFSVCELNFFMYRKEIISKEEYDMFALLIEKVQKKLF